MRRGESYALERRIGCRDEEHLVERYFLAGEAGKQ